jgi:hypothetical protein
LPSPNLTDTLSNNGLAPNCIVIFAATNTGNPLELGKAAMGRYCSIFTGIDAA